MCSPKNRTQTSSSVPPVYISGAGVDNHAIEVWSKENFLHLFENTLVLGPHWFGPVPAEMADWIDKLLPRYGAHWNRAGIYNAILLSKQFINRDENLLAAALCFWNSASNTLDFCVGLMTPTLLDMAKIFGFRPHGRPVDAVGDYHWRKNQERLAIPFTISPATINQNYSFSNYLRKFSTEKDKDQQHMLFLLYWLNRFVFPNRSSATLHNHADVGLGLSHLNPRIYKTLG
ncbi:unnamed protein product [Prunus armeniaca]